MVLGLITFAFSPDSETLASVGRNNVILLWDLNTGVQVWGRRPKQ